MRQFLSQTRLDESTSSTLKAEAMLADLLHDHEKIIRFLRLDVDRCTTLGDQGTADFLTGLMEEHEKMAWMLRSYIA
jgi:starvation-inducible DNA-binding protein